MTYEGIIIGAGHNSLVLQAYLCKAGLKVLCIERASVSGGGLTTMEDPANPGFFHNTHSFYHRALNKMPWYKDLDLEGTCLACNESYFQNKVINWDAEQMKLI